MWKRFQPVVDRPPCAPGWFTVGMERSPLLPRIVRGAVGPLQVGACAVLALGTALPWVWSGERGIDLYELRRVAHRIEADLDLRLLTPIAFVPLVLAASLLARWAGRRALAWVLAVAAALYTGAGAVAVDRSNLDTGSGVTVAALAAVALGLTVVLEWGAGHLPSRRATADAGPRVTPRPETESERSR